MIIRVFHSAKCGCLPSRCGRAAKFVCPAPPQLKSAVQSTVWAAAPVGVVLSDSNLNLFQLLLLKTYGRTEHTHQRENGWTNGLAWRSGGGAVEAWPLARDPVRWPPRRKAFHRWPGTRTSLRAQIATSTLIIRSRRTTLFQGFCPADISCAPREYCSVPSQWFTAGITQSNFLFDYSYGSLV